MSVQGSDKRRDVEFHQAGWTVKPEICIVAVSNDRRVLDRNLLSSDLLRSGDVEVHIEYDAPSASVGYNRGIAATDAPIIVFAHQDVFFPHAWRQMLANQIAAVEKLDPNWALLAPFGVSFEGEHVGRVWSTGLGAIVGEQVAEPTPVQSFDELVIVMRRDAGLRFDETMPRFHLYGTDIVQSALQAGTGAYVVNMPVVHNDQFHDRLGADFAEAYRFARRKWHDALPIRTPVLWITRGAFGFSRYRLQARKSKNKRQLLARDRDVDPRVYSEICGWEPTKSRTEPRPDQS